MAATVDKQRLVPTRTAARMLGVHPETVRRAAAAGLIAAVRFGDPGHLRFRVRDLERLIEGR